MGSGLGSGSSLLQPDRVRVRLGLRDRLGLRARLREQPPADGAAH